MADLDSIVGRVIQLEAERDNLRNRMNQVERELSRLEAELLRMGQWQKKAEQLLMEIQGEHRNAMRGIQACLDAIMEHHQIQPKAVV